MLPWKLQWWSFLALSLALLAMAITALTVQQKHEVIAQLLQSDADILNAVIDLEYQRLSSEPYVPGEYLDLALQASQMQGVLGFAIYSHFGSLLASVPETFAWEFLPTELVTIALNKGYLPWVEWQDVKGHPIILILLPGKEVRSFEEPVHFVYWLDAAPMASQIAHLKQSLWRSAALLWSLGAILLTIVFFFAVKNQELAFKKLADRTRELQQANSQLLLAAKTSAVGSITTHLLHALKNPLSGLRQHLKTMDPDGNAAASAAAMQELLQHTLGMMQEEDEHNEMEFTVEEIFSVLQRKCSKLHLNVQPEFVKTENGNEQTVLIAGRCANLIILILLNLLQNACESTPTGKRVVCNFCYNQDSFSFTVQDQGEGLPPDRLKHPFTVGKSHKERGNGLGLALSQQLTLHLGGQLQLIHSTPELGTHFRLQLPVDAIRQKDY